MALARRNVGLVNPPTGNVTGQFGPNPGRKPVPQMVQQQPGMPPTVAPVGAAPVNDKSYAGRTPGQGAGPTPILPPTPGTPTPSLPPIQLPGPATPGGPQIPGANNNFGLPPGQRMGPNGPVFDNPGSRQDGMPVPGGNRPIDVPTRPGLGGIGRVGGAITETVGGQGGSVAPAPVTTGPIGGGVITETVGPGGLVPDQQRTLGAPGLEEAQAAARARREAEARANSGGVATTQQGGVGVVPPTSQPSGPATQSFGPGDNLIGTQINPTIDPRLQSVQGAVDQAVQGLSNQPNRADLAGQIFDSFATRTDPAYQQRLTQVGRRAAALGRVGSGMTTSELGTVASERNKELAALRQELSAQAAGQQVGDSINTLNALRGTEGQQFGQGAASRGELRGERGYQQGLDQQAINNRIDQFGLQQGAQNQAFGQNQQQQSLLGQLGFGGSSSPLALALAGQYANQGGQSTDLAALLAQLAGQRSG